MASFCWITLSLCLALCVLDFSKSEARGDGLSRAPFSDVPTTVTSQSVDGNATNIKASTSSLVATSLEIVTKIVTDIETQEPDDLIRTTPVVVHERTVGNASVAEDLHATTLPGELVTTIINEEVVATTKAFSPQIIEEVVRSASESAEQVSTQMLTTLITEEDVFTTRHGAGVSQPVQPTVRDTTTLAEVLATSFPIDMKDITTAVEAIPTSSEATIFISEEVGTIADDISTYSQTTSAVERGALGNGSSQSLSTVAAAQTTLGVTTQEVTAEVAQTTAIPTTQAFATTSVPETTVIPTTKVVATTSVPETMVIPTTEDVVTTPAPQTTVIPTTEAVATTQLPQTTDILTTQAFATTRVSQTTVSPTMQAIATTAIPQTTATPIPQTTATPAPPERATSSPPSSSLTSQISKSSTVSLDHTRDGDYRIHASELSDEELESIVTMKFNGITEELWHSNYDDVFRNYVSTLLSTNTLTVHPNHIRYVIPTPLEQRGTLYVSFLVLDRGILKSGPYFISGDELLGTLSDNLGNLTAELGLSEQPAISDQLPDFILDTIPPKEVTKTPQSTPKPRKPVPVFGFLSNPGLFISLLVIATLSIIVIIVGLIYLLCDRRRARSGEYITNHHSPRNSDLELGFDNPAMAENDKAVSNGNGSHITNFKGEMESSDMIVPYDNFTQEELMNYEVEDTHL